ncbi:hypothetical protein [Microbispora sp. H10830]|uniref:hypothetical protein n=1 Tax=Microbispora sp. H10830 TaxID=2729109 RepID=UPI001C71D473|nr:hypothetical protein [Microbispora sp. H10830]
MTGSARLHPHDAVRAMLEADLRWRDTERYDDVRVRVSVACLQAVRSASEDDVLVRVAEWMLLFRDQGGPDDLYDWRAHPHVEDTALRPGDVPDVAARRPPDGWGCPTARTGATSPWPRSGSPSSCCARRPRCPCRPRRAHHRRGEALPSQVRDRAPLAQGQVGLDPGPLVISGSPRATTR